MEQLQVSINTTVGELNTVLASLAKQPFEQVVDIITSYRTQALQQIQAAQSEGQAQQPDLPGITEHEGAAE